MHLFSESVLVCRDDAYLQEIRGGGVEGEVVDTVMLHWLMYSDRLSAVRGECCMLGKSADAGLTLDKIFKSRHCYHGSDVCNVSETHHG